MCVVFEVEEALLQFCLIAGDLDINKGS